MENQTPNPTPQETAPVNPTPAPEQAPVTPAPVQAAPAPQSEPAQPTILIRYPNLVMMILVLRMLAIVFLILGLVIAFAQFFHDTTFLAKIGYFFLYLMLGFFQGIMCWVFSEAIQVWVDTESQTRPADVDARLKSFLKS